MKVNKNPLLYDVFHHPGGDCCLGRIPIDSIDPVAADFVVLDLLVFLETSRGRQGKSTPYTKLYINQTPIFRCDG